MATGNEGKVRGRPGSHVPRPGFDTLRIPHLSPMPSSDGSVSFDELLNSTILPPPGPAHYAARRALWLKPRLAAPRPPEPSTSRDRLTTLLNMPNAINNDQVWKAGIEKVWKGLNDGGLLKRRLPMELVVRPERLASRTVCLTLCFTDQNHSGSLAQRQHMATRGHSSGTRRCLAVG